MDAEKTKITGRVLRMQQQVRTSGGSTVDQGLTFAQMFLAGGYAPEAQIHAEAYLSEHPDNVAGLEMLAKVLERQGDVGRAAQQLQRVVALEPRRVHAWVDLARLRVADAEAALDASLAGDGGGGSSSSSSSSSSLAQDAAIVVSAREATAQAVSRAPANALHVKQLLARLEWRLKKGGVAGASGDAQARVVNDLLLEEARAAPWDASLSIRVCEEYLKMGLLEDALQFCDSSHSFSNNAVWLETAVVVCARRAADSPASPVAVLRHLSCLSLLCRARATADLKLHGQAVSDFAGALATATAALKSPGGAPAAAADSSGTLRELKAQLFYHAAVLLRRDHGDYSDAKASNIMDALRDGPSQRALAHLLARSLAAGPDKSNNTSMAFTTSSHLIDSAMAFGALRQAATAHILGTFERCLGPTWVADSRASHALEPVLDDLQRRGLDARSSPIFFAADVPPAAVNALDVLDRAAVAAGCSLNELVWLCTQRSAEGTGLSPLRDFVCTLLPNLPSHARAMIPRSETASHDDAVAFVRALIAREETALASSSTSTSSEEFGAVVYQVNPPELCVCVTPVQKRFWDALIAAGNLAAPAAVAAIGSHVAPDPASLGEGNVSRCLAELRPLPGTSRLDAIILARVGVHFADEARTAPDDRALQSRVVMYLAPAVRAFHASAGFADAVGQGSRTSSAEVSVLLGVFAAASSASSLALSSDPDVQTLAQTCYVLLSSALAQAGNTGDALEALALTNTMSGLINRAQINLLVGKELTLFASSSAVKPRAGVNGGILNKAQRDAQAKEYLEKASSDFARVRAQFAGRIHSDTADILETGEREIAAACRVMIMPQSPGPSRHSMGGNSPGLASTVDAATLHTGTGGVSVAASPARPLTRMATVAGPSPSVSARVATGFQRQPNLSSFDIAPSSPAIASPLHIGSVPTVPRAAASPVVVESEHATAVSSPVVEALIRDHREEMDEQLKKIESKNTEIAELRKALHRKELEEKDREIAMLRSRLTAPQQQMGVPPVSAQSLPMVMAQSAGGVVHMSPQPTLHVNAIVPGNESLAASVPVPTVTPALFSVPTPVPVHVPVLPDKSSMSHSLKPNLNLQASKSPQKPNIGTPAEVTANKNGATPAPEKDVTAAVKTGLKSAASTPKAPHPVGKQASSSNAMGAAKETPQFEAIVTLKQQAVSTGEEEENVLFVHRAKLHRWGE
eukprot:UC1_evm1s1523